MSDPIVEGEKYRASAKFQILLFSLFSCFLLWLLYRPMTGFEANDEYPAIVSLTPQQIVDLGGSPAFVEVGLYIRDIPKFDFVKGELVAGLTVWFLFDPRLLSLKRLGRFRFDHAKVIYKSDPYTRIEKGKLLARYDMRVVFSLKLNYNNFPLDDHRISLAVTNHFLSPSEVIFNSSRANLVLSPETRIPGWRPIEQAVKTGFLLDKLDEKRKVYHPRAVFSIDFARVGFRHIMVIIMPLLLIFMISLFTWTFNPLGRLVTGIMTISVMSISAVITHHFVIERMSPDTGYFMISNYVFILTLIFCFMVFMINVVGKKIPGFYKNIAALGLYIILAIFLFRFIRPLF
jgi:hypothetical protein